jgi:hypothetical protein
MFRFITRGTSSARGEQQGRACRELILSWFRQRLSHSAPAAPERLDRLLAGFQRVYPEGFEESRGIAHGLGLAEADYFRVTFGFLEHLPQCTTCGVRARDGEPLIAKTDDLYASEVGRNVMETSLPEAGYRHVHFHFAGTIWTVAGMNETGLAIAMTGIPGPVLDQDGLPSLVGLHRILPACATVSEAVAHLRKLPVNSYGFSLQIGDAAGGLALLEKTGIGTVVLDGRTGAPLLHTNHILDEEFARRNPLQKEPIGVNGQRRLETAAAQMRSLPRTEEGLQRLLLDRSPRGPICQQGEDGMHTDFAVIFAPTQKRMTFWPGPPATTTVEAVEMDSLFA